MYIRPPKKRRASPLRIIILLLLDAAGIYLLVWRRDLIQPIQVGPTPTPTATARDVMAEAQDLYREGLLDDAIERYAEAASLDPTDPMPLVWSSFLLTLRQRTSQAVELARQAVGRAPDRAEALAALCMALDWDAGVGEEEKLQEALHADLGQKSQAVEMARLAVALDDSSPFAHRDLAYALQKQGKYSDAQAEYERASQLHPRLAQPFIDLGRLHMSRNRYQDALAAFEKGTVVEADSAPAFYWLGWAYFNTGDPRRAAVVLEKAVEADPAFAPAYGYLGHSYYVIRNYEGAIDALRKAIELGADQLDYYQELGLAYAYLERCDEARPWLLKALEIDNTSAAAWDGLDRCPEN
jgi:tetratricopeptide (TPR) repeat protein